MPASEVVFSRNDVVSVEVGDRTFEVAPLPYTERAAFERALRAAGITFPSNRDIIRRVRAVMRRIAPANLAEIEAILDNAEVSSSEGDVLDEMVYALGPIERIASEEDEMLRGLYADRSHWLSMAPYEATRWALRGWSGPELPDFTRLKEVGQSTPLVPRPLMNALSDEEVQIVGFRAINLMRPSRSAEKNSGSPSPSSDSPGPSPTI